MSYSSLYRIDKKYMGQGFKTYKNSWLFSPMVWDILLEKYIPQDVITLYGYKKSLICDFDRTLWTKLNDSLNASDNLADRVCWEMSNQQIFYVRDKAIVARCIRQFVEQNKEYDKSPNDNLSPLERDHIVERFNEIATDIEGLDWSEYEYFVFKNTSCDDAVEFWFREYDERTDSYNEKYLDEWDRFLAEFVEIEDGERISRFISNLDHEYMEVRPMESVIISIQPKWCKLIADKTKTIEIRKNFPRCKTPFKCYIYCTKDATGDYYGSQKIIGEFVCKNIETLTEADLFAGMDEINKSRIEEFSCVDIDELLRYKGEKETIYGWYISNLKIYDKPKTLEDFRKPCISPEMPYCPNCEVGYEYISETEAEFYRIDGECSTEWCCLNWIKKPPQSWCYAVPHWKKQVM